MTTTTEASREAFVMVTKVQRQVFAKHPLGLPNTNSTAYRVDTNHGHAYFALGRYSQHADPAVITLTRELFPDHNASHFLAVFRRWLRVHTSYRAVQTYTDPSHQGTHLEADGWVYVANHAGNKRWIHSLTA